MKQYFRNSLIAIFLFFCVATSAQVGIGTVTPDPSAILDIRSDDAGVLLPKINLLSNTDQVTIPNPAPGLLLYNEGLGGLAFVGYVYWNGSEWRTLFNTSTAPGTIENFTCSGVSLIQPTYQIGVPYNGTMTLPYTGGNGGAYEGLVLGPINGLTATLAPGNFNIGPGNIVFTVTGIPTVSSPTISSFSISLGGQSCTAAVGIGQRGVLSEYAQVSFESYGSAIAGTSPIGTLADISPGAVNIARVKRLNRGVFRVDFAVPFLDDSYVVSGYGFEPGYYNGDNRQPYLYIPSYSVVTNALGAAIMNDSDVDPFPTNPSYNLETRQTIVKPDGYNSVIVKYRTHFYIVEGYGHFPLAGASLSVTR